MDIIHIKNLEVFANHGVFEEEQVLGQKFLVNADLFTDFSKAAKTEDLDMSIDYGSVSQTIVEFMQENTCQLIETVAVGLANYLLLNIKLLRQVRIEIKKPWAPLKYSLETASVEVIRGWHTAYLSLGTNIGEREVYMANALNALKGNKFIRLEKVSPIYETKAYGGVEQPDFLNNCVEISTILEPLELLDYLHEIEASNQRERIIHWGPRTLDMDILLYDDLIMHTDKLSIPHIDMHNRLFVLQPLNDIAPYSYHPVKRATTQELLEGLMNSQKNR